MSGDDFFFMTAPEEPDPNTYVDSELIAGNCAECTGDKTVSIGNLTLNEFASMTFKNFEKIDTDGNIGKSLFLATQTEIRTFLYFVGEY